MKLPAVHDAQQKMVQVPKLSSPQPAITKLSSNPSSSNKANSRHQQQQTPSNNANHSQKNNVRPEKQNAVKSLSTNTDHSEKHVHGPRTIIRYDQSTMC